MGRGQKSSLPRPTAYAIDHGTEQDLEVHATEEGRDRNTQATGGDPMAFHILIVTLAAIVSRMILVLFGPARFA